MKKTYMLAMTFIASGTMAFAQMCPSTPGSVCVVPPRSAAVSQQCASTYTPVATSSYVVLPNGCIAAAPMSACPMPTASCPIVGMSAIAPTCSTASISMGYPLTVVPSSPQLSADAACLANQVAALRGDVRLVQGSMLATALAMRGQTLVDRMNDLMANEMLFRQQIAETPNLPGAQAMATRLSQQANTLNRDIAAYNRQLALVPTDQQPFVAQNLNTFIVSAWNPATQQFNAYSEQFAQASTTYQPAYAANPWLQNWQTTYQMSLNNINTGQQTIASADWWTNMRVAGSTEFYQPGTVLTTTMPQNTMCPTPTTTCPTGVIYIPATTTTCPTTGTGF